MPEQRFSFLGVHVTPTITGEIEAGLNAVLATGREAYRFTDVDWRDMPETVGYSRGFRRLARRYWRVGATEIRRTLSRRPLQSQSAAWCQVSTTRSSFSQAAASARKHWTGRGTWWMTS